MTVKTSHVVPNGYIAVLLDWRSPEHIVPVRTYTAGQLRPKNATLVARGQSSVIVHDRTGSWTIVNHQGEPVRREVADSHSAPRPWRRLILLGAILTGAVNIALFAVGLWPYSGQTMVANIFWLYPLCVVIETPFGVYLVGMMYALSKLVWLTATNMRDDRRATRQKRLRT